MIDPFHEIIKVQIPKQDSLALEVNHFIQCVLGHAKVAITPLEATQALELVESMVADLQGQSQRRKK